MQQIQQGKNLYDQAYTMNLITEIYEQVEAIRPGVARLTIVRSLQRAEPRTPLQRAIHEIAIRKISEVTLSGDVTGEDANED